ncbi:MAG: hypothetical protein ACLR56_15505 [Oscillospiraceae bacterium]
MSGWLSDRVQPSRLVAALIVTSVVNLSVRLVVVRMPYGINGAAGVYLPPLVDGA